MSATPSIIVSFSVFDTISGAEVNLNLTLQEAEQLRDQLIATVGKPKQVRRVIKDKPRSKKMEAKV
jgi:hypothetical protein